MLDKYKRQEQRKNQKDDRGGEEIESRGNNGDGERKLKRSG